MCSGVVLSIINPYYGAHRGIAIDVCTIIEQLYGEYIYKAACELNFRGGGRRGRAYNSV